MQAGRFGSLFELEINLVEIAADAEQHTVIVRYGEGDTLIEQLRSLGPERWLLRKLQRYCVTVYEHELRRMLNDRLVESVQGFYVQCTVPVYHPDLGLLFEALYNSADLII